jgi:hypothetical protein
MKRIAFAMFLSIIMCGQIWAQATAQISGAARDQSGAVLPGVEITATQTETAIARTAVTNETGSYVLPNLPIGPYKLEASLPGFRAYAQTGIVLQVNSSSTINVVLEVGQVSEQIEVQANATLVETRNAGIGQVVENARILELPLNGRAMIELVALAGTATPAPIIDGSGGRDPFSKGNVSVAGGLNTGLNYTLDGAFHNNPFDNGYMSMPFPDALQEFKVETGATGAQNGVKSSGSVSLVTKSGTNEIHGDLFEFVRNGMFNARNAFAARRDTIKRNQFGGTLGGAILKNRLFFFGGYQGTTIRQDPSDIIQYVPTAAMLSGDFTAIASPACNAGRQMALKAPFVNDRVDPSLFSKAALALTSKLPKATDECGTTKFGMPRPENDHMAIGRIDYQRSANHSVFGRYLLDTVHTTAPFEITKSLLAINNQGTGNKGRAQAFTLGDTYLFGANVVNALRLTTNRIYGEKFLPDFGQNPFGPADLGVKAFNYNPHLLVNFVTGGFQTWCGGCGAGKTTVAIFALNDDISVLRGNHQLAFGGQGAMWWSNSYSDTYSQLTMNFNGQTSGMGMSDFLLGNVSSFTMGTNGDQQKRSRYYGLYGTDTWKVNQKLTFNYGLRWEPYFPMIHRDGTAMHFDLDSARKGIKSTRFDNTPPGLLFNGDPGFVGGDAGMKNKWWNFSPRVGFAWDVAGDGRTSIRTSVGTFYDVPSTYYLRGLANGAPWLPRYLRNNVKYDNPWASEPGGDPFPLPHGRGIPRNVPWPANAYVVWLNPDSQNMQVTQWNVALQKQLATNWLLSATYIGSATRHLWSIQQANPAVFLGLNPCTLNGVAYPTCSVTGNQDQRRRLSLENPALGRYYGAIQRVDPGGTASYNGLLVSAQRQAARGITVSGNYTWAHCISDPGGDTAVDSLTAGWTNPDDRSFDRGNCSGSSTDRRHVFNLSAVATTPQFSRPALRAIASGWRLSPIFRVLSGDYVSVTTNQDRALSGIGNQHANQVTENPYGDKTAQKWLSPAAFALPTPGTLGNLGANNVRRPGYWQFDTAISRSFQVREMQRVEFRVEAFNVTNAFRMDGEKLTNNVSSNTFGQVLGAKEPRIMQFALKYVF